ncbi:MAG: 2Fe-2S iron-sulfur cluster-binding protein [Aquabacterium sp.]
MDDTSPTGPSILRIEPAGWEVPILPGQSLIEAALAAGIQMPRSCRNGSCRACLCRLVSGEVSYRVEWPGLSFDEKADGDVLPCVAIPETPRVVLNVPAASRPGA